MTSQFSELTQLQPFDAYNQELADQVHPSTWTNPTPSGRYNLVVIGAGTAGLVTAAGAAGLGAKVALIERELMGGDCLNVGCVPSKALVSAARAAAELRRASALGVRGEASVDFSQVMERMRRLRAEISHHDSAKRFTSLGVDVFLGQGVFTSASTIDVAGATLHFKRAVIATGARAQLPEIPGIAEIAALTNESVFSLTQLPARLTIIGGGPIGCELAQAFANFGSQVTLLEKSNLILSREDLQAASIVQEALRRDGVKILTQSSVKRCSVRGKDKIVTVDHNGQELELASDEVLIGVGRAPNVDGLGLEAAQVTYDARNGVFVNDQLQTSNPAIYAAGDIASRFKFTHAADFLARIAIQNALFRRRARASDLVIPWCTYTTPELAHVGLLPEQAARDGVDVDTYTQEFSAVDRTILEGRTEGFVRVHVKKGTDRIIGATIVADNAGDMIGELSLAMTNGIGLSKIGASIHPYPTRAEAIRKLGDQYSRTRLTPVVKALFKSWLRLTR